MIDPAFVLQLVINGLVIGIVYALISVGLSLIFGVLEIVNFAHGEFYMLGAMLAFFLTSNMELNYWLTIAIVVVVCFAIGYVFYYSLLSNMRGATFERSMLLTLGLSMVLQNGAIFLFSSTPRALRNEYSFQSFEFGDIKISVLRALALGLGIVAFALLYFVLYRSRVGKAMRAVAQNREAAAMVGIDPKSVSALTVAIGIGLSGLAGSTLAPIYSVHPGMGASFIFKAFALVIIGGMGNVNGTLVAAIALGVLESVVGGYAPLVVVDAMAFICMLAILLIRPEGIFGRGVRI